MIFHIKRNSNLSITEILYSIDYSYRAYCDELKALEKEINNAKKKNNKQEFTSKRNEIILNSDVEKIIYVKYLYL